MNHDVVSCQHPSHRHGLTVPSAISQERLYTVLGADRAPLATPVMLEGGEVEWHSFLDDDKGQKGESLGCAG